MAPLLQFKAGRSFRQGETNEVVSNPDRGLIYLEEEDGLLHFYYKDLATSSILEDLIIFPGDASFQPANKAHRVSVLKFNSSSARHFFWHQDASLSEQEFEQRGRRVNELIGGDETDGDADADAGMQVEAAAPAPTATSTTRGGPPPVSGQQALQLENILSAFRAASGTGGQPSTTSAAGGGDMQALQAALRRAGSSSGPADLETPLSLPEYTLPDVLPSSALTRLVASLPSDAVAHLASFLPATLSTTSGDDNTATQRASVVRALTSPEFRRATASLDRALRTGATAPVLRSLGMARGEEGVDEFLREIAATAGTRPGTDTNANAGEEQRERGENEGERGTGGAGDRMQE
ncbi:hypothetical protein JCM11491_001082 [Sporobolomyces phaffii]